MESFEIFATNDVTMNFACTYTRYCESVRYDQHLLLTVHHGGSQNVFESLGR